MAISYPLTLPTTPGFTNTKWLPVTVVGMTRAPATLQSQTFVWPGQGWGFRGLLPKIVANADADAWVAFKLSLNGQQGTFNLGDKTRPTTRGSAAGSKTVGSGASALSTTLPIAGGTGSFAVGDWLQIVNDLYKVLKVNSTTSVDVWPRLRSAYASGTAITYTNAKGLFRLEDNDMEWDIDTMKHYGVELRAVEAL